MIYPKPFQGKANLLFAENGLFTVKVFATDGREVATQKVEARSGEIHEVSLGKAEAGTYVVTIIKGDKIVRSFKIQK